MLKDYWGNDALDFGPKEQLLKKYPDKILVTVSNRPFGDTYLLLLCNADEDEKADAYIADFHAKMQARGIRAYGLGSSLGSHLYYEKMKYFEGTQGCVV